MIITLRSDATPDFIQIVLDVAARYEGVSPRKYEFQGVSGAATEVHLLGDTSQVPEKAFQVLPGVRRVVRVSNKYRVIGRHGQREADVGFTYNGVSFDEREVLVFAGLCAVDTLESVEAMMKLCQENGLSTTRMGAYKPRTSPYDFQGLGAACLPWVFELAGKYGIKVIAMEVCDARHIDEILSALEASGNATGVMLQIGTRNTQNFELLKQVGRQGKLPVLVKRGMGITLEESLNACEYVATEGQPNMVFCLRGVKSHLGDPHRNLVDFAHVPVVRSQTRMPVCIDPSHSVGRFHFAPDGLPESYHATGMGVVAGASMVLVDFHPDPSTALCDGPQALTPEYLPGFLAYVRQMRAAYEAVVQAGPITDA